MNMEKFYNRLSVAVVALGVLTMGGIFVSKANAADATFVKEVISPVVQLERNCSGVVLEVGKPSDTIIATANHCVSGDASPSEKSGYVMIDEKDGQKVTMTNQYVYDVVIRDTTNDMALIKLRKEGLFLDGATLASTDPTEGDTTWAVGYPLGLPRAVTTGLFGGWISLTPDMSFDQFGNGRGVYRSATPIFGGNSGGGLFMKDNDKYKLVGIADAGFSIYPFSAFFNPQEPLNKMVDRGLKLIQDEDKTAIVVEDKKTN